LVFLAPPIISPYKGLYDYFNAKTGNLNTNLESEVLRSDGSKTRISPEFWREIKGIEPIGLYQEVVKSKEVYLYKLNRIEIFLNFSQSRNLIRI
jgi:hypothetical protein